MAAPTREDRKREEMYQKGRENGRQDTLREIVNKMRSIKQESQKQEDANFSPENYVVMWDNISRYLRRECDAFASPEKGELE